MDSDDHAMKLLERAFWWLVGIAGTLFCAAVTALCSVLWSMNASIVTLNERVGDLIEEGSNFHQQVDEQIKDLASRIRRLEDDSLPQKEKSRH